MLEMAYNNMETEGMMPEEFDYMEIPTFTLKLNAPDCCHRPSKHTKTTITSRSKAKGRSTAMWQRIRSISFVSLEDMLIAYD
jgi:hypothetical protein